MLDLTVLDAAELSSLSKAMHEARFPEVWDDPIVWLSPFVVDLHVAATEESRRRIAESGDPSRLKDFDAWLRRPTRPEFEIFKARLDEDPWLQQKVCSEKSAFIRWALQPYVVSDAIADEIVDYAEKLSGASPTNV